MTKIQNIVDTVARRINQVIEFAVTMALVVLFVLTMTEVGGRYVFRNSFPWIPEAAGYLLSFITFFGVSCLVYKKDLMNIDFVYNKFPKIVRKALNVVFWGLIMYYAQILITAGYRFAQMAAGQYSNSLVFNLQHMRMIIPIAGALMAFQAFNKILQEFKKEESNNVA